MNWLKRELFGVKIGGFIVFAVILEYAYIFSAFSLFPGIFTHLQSISTGLKINILLPAILLFCALAEELLFRFLPLGIAVEKCKTAGGVITVAICSSMVFGIVHGNAYNIAVQGVSGFIMSIVFLKCGGFQKNFTKAITCSTAMHFLSNSVILVMLMLQGKKVL